MPPSEIVLRPTDRPASEERPERGVRVPQQQAEPEAPAPITTPRRSKFAGLKLAAKRGGAPGGQWPQEQGEPVAPQPSPRRVSEAIEREERLQRALATYAEAWADAGRMTRAGLPVLAHQAQALERSGQALEAIAPDLTRETRALLERSPELAGGIAGPGGAAALSAAIGAEQGARQALDERGRAAVRTWNVLEREYDAATKAYEWDAQREVGTRMEAFAEALKRDPQLDRVLRERGGALGVAEGSRLDQVLHAREIDSRLLWKLGIEHGPRPGRGMSLGM
jgi:hypothetical protein